MARPHRGLASDAGLALVRLAGGGREWLLRPGGDAQGALLGRDAGVAAEYAAEVAKVGKANRCGRFRHGDAAPQ